MFVALIPGSPIICPVCGGLSIINFENKFIPVQPIQEEELFREQPKLGATVRECRRMIENDIKLQ